MFYQNKLSMCRVFVYMNEFRIVIGSISMIYAFIMWLLAFNGFFLIKTVTLLFNYIYFSFFSISANIMWD